MSRFCNDLGQPHRVRDQEDGGFRQMNRQCMPPFVQQRPADADRLVDDVLDRRRLQHELDLVGIDPGGIDEVVHQPGEVGHLAGDPLMRGRTAASIDDSLDSRWPSTSRPVTIEANGFEAHDRAWR